MPKVKFETTKKDSCLWDKHMSPELAAHNQTQTGVFNLIINGESMTFEPMAQGKNPNRTPGVKGTRGGAWNLIPLGTPVVIEVPQG